MNYNVFVSVFNVFQISKNIIFESAFQSLQTAEFKKYSTSVLSESVEVQSIYPKALVKI